MRRGSWMAPDARRSILLYVSDLGNDQVDVFSYPRGKLKGTLTGFSAPHGECVDKAGNVFIANEGASQILEYAHGGTAPIKILKDDGYFPSGCSIDPTTGNLAVANYSPLGSGPGGVAIYERARAKPRHYFDSSGLFFSYYCGYDAHGNLFVDGMNSSANTFEFAELPAHSTHFKNIALNVPVALPGGVQAVGKRVAVGDQVSLSGPSKIDEFSIRGGSGTQVHTTPLNNSCNVLQFWISGRHAIVPNGCGHSVMYFHFPAGGTSIKTIGGLSSPVGLTLSRN